MCRLCAIDGLTDRHDWKPQDKPRGYRSKARTLLDDPVRNARIAILEQLAKAKVANLQLVE